MLKETGHFVDDHNYTEIEDATLFYKQIIECCG